MPTFCSTPQTLTMSISQSLPHTMSVGDTLDVSAIYDTNDGNDECIQTINWTVTINEGAPSSWATEGSANEDTVYTETYTASQAGRHVISGQLVWSQQNPPSDANILDGNELQIRVWKEKVKASVPMEGENAAPTDGITDENAAPTDAITTELPKPDGGFTENTAPSGGFSEQE